MLGRSLAVVLALSTAAAAYPVVLAHPSATAQAKRRADFVARNPEAWVDVRLDEQGFVVHALTADPALATATLDDLRAFARRNADLFGMVAADADRIAPFTRGSGAAWFESDDGALLGGISLVQTSMNGKPALEVEVTPWIDAPSKTSAADVVQMLTGLHYVDRATYGHRPHLDCAMGPGGGRRACVSVDYGTIARDHAIAASDVHVTTALTLDASTVRLVRCADLSTMKPPPPDPSWPRGDVVARELVPVGGAPVLPLVVDAVTGQTVATHAARCDDLRRLR